MRSKQESSHGGNPFAWAGCGHPSMPVRPQECHVCLSQKLDSVQKERDGFAAQFALLDTKRVLHEAVIERLKADMAFYKQSAENLASHNADQRDGVKDIAKGLEIQLCEARNALQVIKECSEGNEPLLMSIHSIARRGLKQSGDAEKQVCEHDWKDARNQAVESGEVCIKCWAIRAGNETSEKRVCEACPHEYHGGRSECGIRTQEELCVCNWQPWKLPQKLVCACSVPPAPEGVCQGCWLERV